MLRVFYCQQNKAPVFSFFFFFFFCFVLFVGFFARQRSTDLSKHGDPDQTTLLGAFLSGSILFAKEAV